jgi:hypothetical protein
LKEQFPISQRGRKSRALRDIIPLAPHLVGSAPPRNLTPPPELLAEPEQKVWTAIMRNYDFNRGGEFLLENALLSLERARKCREIIDRDGPLLTRRDGLPKRHPLLSIEAQSRKLVQAIFKLLKIDLREDWI